MLVVDPKLNDAEVDFFKKILEQELAALVLKADTHETALLEKGKIVFALEKSVPPYYKWDTVRCLHEEKVYHIKRRDLKHVTRNKKR